MHESVRLPAVPESAANARDFVETVLRTWECTGVVDNARVVVTELVSNVVRHAGTDLDVDLGLVGDCIRLTVVDRGGGAIVVRNADDQAEVGRGLRLVDKLAGRWGVEEQPGRKCAWVEWNLAGRSASSHA